MKHMATAKNVKKLVRRSISLRPEINSKVQVLAKRERRSTNQILEKLIEAGLETQENEKRRFFELAERLIAATRPSERQRLKEELARKTFGAWVPKIQWTDLPSALRDHLFERLRERKITVDDLYQLKLWREAEPEAPDGPWYKDFGSFKICGEGKYPKTFLLRGQPAKGEKL
jgi:hypothetical protein